MLKINKKVLIRTECWWRCDIQEIICFETCVGPQPMSSDLSREKAPFSPCPKQRHKVWWKLKFQWFVHISNCIQKVICRLQGGWRPKYQAKGILQRGNKPNKAKKNKRLLPCQDHPYQKTGENYIGKMTAHPYCSNTQTNRRLVAKITCGWLEVEEDEEKCHLLDCRHLGLFIFGGLGCCRSQLRAWLSVCL